MRFIQLATSRPTQKKSRVSQINTNEAGFIYVSLHNELVSGEAAAVFSSPWTFFNFLSQKALNKLLVNEHNVIEIARTKPYICNDVYNTTQLIVWFLQG